MAKPYSDDFRHKVMQGIELDGLKKCEASRLFNISRNTINLWFQRKAETGDVRAVFLTQLENPKAPHLVYVDESGMDERDNYGYGYSPVGERFYDLKSGCRKGRINMIPGYRDGQIIAPFTIGGACNRTVFETWLETCLIPMLRPGEWVIVDNATFDRGGRIAQLIEDAGCQLVYLPPYSPDLNRIEKCWATLKSKIRKLLSTSDNLRDAMEIVLKQAAS